MSYILAEMKGHADPKKRMRQLQAATDSALLRLFVKRWMRAKLGDQIDAHQFAWTEAVDWLVRELREATPLSPGATRAPRSPRLASPKVAPAASPAKPAPAARGTLVAAQTVSANSSTRPKVAAPSRSFAGGATTVPAYVLAPPVPLQSGRQAMSRRVQSYLESPTRLTEAPLPASATRRRQRRHAHFSAMQSASAAPTPATVDHGKADAASLQPPVRAKTLLDIVMQEYSASLASSGDNLAADSAAEARQ